MAVTGSSALALTGITSCDKPASEKKSVINHGVKPFELDELTISDLQDAMKTGKYTARSICEMYLSRINEIDKHGPSLNSVLEINPDALAIADELDKERQSNKVRGPLHGIPVMIKDNINTADKMTTTAGSLALKGSIAAQDSFVAKKLREAGAVILGKTNLSEWANFRSSYSTSGWSGRGGQTRNPYALDRNPCGSSSGSGVAVSSNLCAITIGTETNGSVVCPSSANGIVGIKPTVGLVGRSGIIPIAHTQDTAGPMARTVKDAVILLGALSGIDPRDDITKESESKSYKDYTRFLDPQGMKGKRIGVARNYFGFHPKVDELMNTAIEKMKELGAVIVDPANIETRGEYGSSSFDVLLYEFKADLNKYLASLDKNVAVHSLKELIKFNEANKDLEMPYFGQDILHLAQEKGDLSSREYIDALKKVKELSRDKGIDATLKKHNIDAIIAPTGGPAWFTDWVNGDHFLGSSSSPAARSGYPNITIPAGFIHGLPVGISFFSTAYSEPLLIKLTYAFEQATKHRRPPQFLPGVNFN
ncbi:MAG: amidase [Calditrichia bacterium]|nr:amidase [Calditrichia bacterium]